MKGDQLVGYQHLSDAGVNWADVDVLSDKGINWTDINVLSDAGVNWVSVRT